MYASEIARILHIDEQEFQKIEPSVATVLKLNQDEEGRFLYNKENLKVLRNLFEQAVGGAPDEEEILGSIPESIPVKESRPYQWEKIQAEETPKALKKSSGPKESGKERKIVPATDVLKRITKDGQAALRHRKEPVEVTMELEKIQKILQEQRTFLEERLEQRELNLSIKLESQIFDLKKENQALRKRVDTLQKIIKNQNEDKRYLIEKINQKYSLWNLIQWKQNRQVLGNDEAEDKSNS